VPPALLGFADEDGRFGTNLPIRDVRSPVANGGKADNICLF
jgi:hypothetical protein